jgi:replication initiation protein RepC
MRRRLSHLTKAGGSITSDDPLVATGEDSESFNGDIDLPTVPLGLVMRACTECLTYSDRPVRHRHDLVALAHDIRPMMSVSPSAWDDAKRAMGP